MNNNADYGEKLKCNTDELQYRCDPSEWSAAQTMCG